MGLVPAMPGEQSKHCASDWDETQPMDISMPVLDTRQTKKKGFVEIPSTWTDSQLDDADDLGDEERGHQTHTAALPDKAQEAQEADSADST